MRKRIFLPTTIITITNIIIKEATPEKKGKGSAAQEKPAASKRKQKQKQEQPPPVDVEEEESDPLYIADVDDLTGSDKEDDPDPVLSIADSPSKETFILTPQSPVQKVGPQKMYFECSVNLFTSVHSYSRPNLLWTMALVWHCCRSMTLAVA
nr:uncharacterized protein LOC113804343 [Penaeus vannamei]